MSQSQVNQRMLTTSACHDIEKHTVILQIFDALKFRKQVKPTTTENTENKTTPKM